MVDEAGCYTYKSNLHLHGKFVLDEGTEQVIKMISEDIVHREEYVHSYPYDWRTKKPIILRASQQWFVNTEAIKGKAIVCENVNSLFYF